MANRFQKHMQQIKQAEYQQLTKKSDLEFSRKRLWEKVERFDKLHVTSEELLLAVSYEAWMESIDTDGIMTEDEFHTLPLFDKIEIIREVS